MQSDALHAVYRLTVSGPAAARRAEALALEQSVEMPAEAIADPRVLRDVVARVERLEAQADGTTLVHLRLSAETIAADAGQLMNMLFGNSSLLDDVQVVAVDIPDAMAAQFGGPALGIDGVRRLAGVHGRALSCTALKPIGSSLADLARITRVFADAGIDVIKDDHGWAARGSAPFFERVVACQREIDLACRGRVTRTLYVPALSGTMDDMRTQLRFVRAHGVDAVLLAPMIAGVSNFNALRREFPGTAFLAHPALAGNQFAPAALLGTLFRVFGADAVIFPNQGGRFSYSRAVCRSIATNLRTTRVGVAPALPVPAGGMSVERVAELVSAYGHDTILLIGGSLFAAGDALPARSRAFVEAVAAASSQVPA